MREAETDMQVIEDQFLSGILRPPPRLNSWEWCEEHIVIPAETGTPWPGKYRRTETPWVTGWYEIIQDPETFLFAIQKGAQIAATQTFMNAAFYWTCNDPGALLYVMDSEANMRNTSKLRLKPIIEASPTLHAELRSVTEGSDRKEMDNLLYQFQRCYWRMIGASSAGKASSFTHRYLILEEPEKYKDQVQREGNVIENLLQRVKRIWNAKILIGCTPSTKQGFIHKYMQYGDLNLYFVPCPHCGTGIVLRFSEQYGKATFPDDIPIPGAFVEFDSELSPVEAARSARLVCRCCGKAISDQQKREIVDDGKWEPTKEPDITGYRSAWIGGLYPKDDSASVRAFVEAFLSKKGNASDLQVWVNSDCGELWEDHPKKSVAKKAITDIRDKLQFPRGVVPTDGEAILIMTCDVQAHHVPFAVWAMDRRNQWLVDHGVVSVLADLPHVYSNEYFYGVQDDDGSWQKGDERIHCRRLFIDARHRTTEVYKFCLTHSWAVPIMGERGVKTRQAKPVAPSAPINRFPDGKPFAGRREIRILHIHPRHFKDQLSDVLDFTLNDDGVVDTSNPVADLRIWFHRDIDGEFIRQMCGEVLREGDPDKYGAVAQYWVKIDTNDFFDLAQYGFAVRHVGHNDLLRLRSTRQPEPVDETKNQDKPPAQKGEQSGKRKRKVLSPVVDPNAVRL